MWPPLRCEARRVFCKNLKKVQESLFYQMQGLKISALLFESSCLFMLIFSCQFSLSILSSFKMFFVSDEESLKCLLSDELYNSFSIFDPSKLEYFKKFKCGNPLRENFLNIMISIDYYYEIQNSVYTNSFNHNNNELKKYESIYNYIL